MDRYGAVEDHRDGEELPKSGVQVDPGSQRLYRDMAKRTCRRPMPRIDLASRSLKRAMRSME
jgi:hypothetical protein